MRNFIIINITLLLFMSVLAVAQPVVQLPPEPDIVPITGIEYLLMGGGAYGIYRFQKRRNKKKEA